MAPVICRRQACRALPIAPSVIGTACAPDHIIGALTTGGAAKCTVSTISAVSIFANAADEIIGTAARRGVTGCVAGVAVVTAN